MVGNTRIAKKNCRITKSSLILKIFYQMKNGLKTVLFIDAVVKQ